MRDDRRTVVKDKKKCFTGSKKGERKIKDKKGKWSKKRVKRQGREGKQGTGGMEGRFGVTKLWEGRK